MAEGYKMKHDHTMKIVAWHACAVRNVHLKRGDQKTPDQLLGNKTSQSQMDIATTIEQAISMVKERREKEENGDYNSIPPR